MHQSIMNNSALNDEIELRKKAERADQDDSSQIQFCWIEADAE